MRRVRRYRRHGGVGDELEHVAQSPARARSQAGPDLIRLVDPVPASPRLVAYPACGKSGSCCAGRSWGAPSIACISQVTWFRSRLFSTATMSRGFSHSRQYLPIVMSSLIPFICMAPSPTSAMTGRPGWPNFAPMAYGTPGPIVARVPDSEPARRR